MINLIPTNFVDNRKFGKVFYILPHSNHFITDKK